MFASDHQAGPANESGNCEALIVSSVCTCVCISGIRAQLHYWLNLQRGKWQLCPSAWAETLGPQAWGWAPAAGQKEFLLLL